MIYMLWQANMQITIAENVIRAMEHHAKRYGRIPNVVEYSDRLPKTDIPRFDGVITHIISVPANIILLAVKD